MTGNNGNNGNNGNAGNRGSAGIVGEFGGGWFIEDRVDLPFVTLPFPSVLLEESRPQAGSFNEFEDRIGGLIRHTPKTFADRQWTARWSAWRVLDPFARSDWFSAAGDGMPSANDAMLAAWEVAIREEATDQELLELARAARDERGSAIGEILSQDVEFITDFMALLSMTPASHPHTYGLLHIGSQIGSYAALHFKMKETWGNAPPGPRPRPSQLLPALMPPVPLPGHPAFPSGHATQAWLMAKSVTLALQIARMVSSNPNFRASETHLRLGLQTAWLSPGDTETPELHDRLLGLLQQAELVSDADIREMNGMVLPLLHKAGIDPAEADFRVTRDDLLALAITIARNREIAGLHYPSDSAAGRTLADIVLRELAGIDTFISAVNGASREWRDGAKP